METACFFFIPFEALLCDQSETLQSLPQILCLDNNENRGDVFPFYVYACVCVFVEGETLFHDYLSIQNTESQDQEF